MKAKLFDKKGKDTGETLNLNTKVWQVDENPDLIAQVLYVFNSNKRRGTASAKGRGEVAGGGRKPWRQKGTGRARAGSIRSPLWAKGGVIFPPKGRNWKRKVNDKMKKKAIASVLSSKLKEDALNFVKFSKSNKGKELRKDLLGMDGETKVLVVSDKEDVLKAVRNVKNFKIAKPEHLNIYQSLDNSKIIVDQEAVNILEKRLDNDEK